MSRKRKMTRREFLRASAVVTAGAVSAACAPPATPTKEATPKPTATPKPEKPTATPKPEATPKPAAKYNQAPMLDELVEAGELPPVDERLPAEPKVLQTVEEIGQYGGIWHRAFLGPADGSNPGRLLRYRSFLAWSLDGTTVIPHVGKSWEWSEEYKLLTCHLRSGMRWSDGESFTADDVLFWWEDIIMNDDLTPAKPWRWKVKGELISFEKVDDYTFNIRAPHTFPLLLRWLAMGSDIFAPKHYLKQFHPEYTSGEELDKKVAEEEYEHWYELFMAKNEPFENPERPCIQTWRVTSPITEDELILERNPYYWGVDSEGNQLPYIDKISMRYAEKPETVTMRAAAGELDMQGRHISISSYPVLKKNAEKGDYRINLYSNSGGCDEGIMFSFTYKGDDVLRDLFREKKFRIALSLAIDREEINEGVFLGLGEGRQLVPCKGPYYPGDEYAYKYTEYDPERANEFLDELDLKWDEKHEYRLRPDGKRLAVEVAAIPAFGPWVDATEMVCSQWKEVGVEASTDVQERSLYYERNSADKNQVAVWNTGGAEHLFVYPYWTALNDGRHGGSLATWYNTDGEAGVEPTWDPDILKTMELHKKGAGATKEERVEMAKEIFRLMAENVWTIGVVGCSPMIMGTVVIRNDFRNVPDPEKVRVDNSVVVAFPGNMRPEQFFFEKA